MRIILFHVAFFLSSALMAQQYSKVKIYTGSEGLTFLAERGLAVDHGTYKKDVYFITDLSTHEINQLSEYGYNYEILIQDVQKFYVDRNKKGNDNTLKNLICSSGSSSSSTSVSAPVNFELNMAYAGYYKYEGMLAELDSMAALYPNLITVKSLISNFLTHEGRPIYHVKISDNPNSEEAEPEVLYTAVHHAREPLSMSQTIFYMWYLLENYATNEEVKFLVDNTEMYFVPCINPDGYIENETTNPNGGGMHRKNKNPAIGVNNVGVDLNRNYSYQWNTTGISSSQESDVFPGVSPFSEPETQAMKWMHENHTFISASNSHTYGNTLLFPIGSTAAEFADHHDYFTDLCGHMVSRNGYFPQKSSGLYPASGDSDDYAYKVDIGVGLKDTVFAFTPEVGTDFWPAASEIIPTSQGMVFTNLMFSHLTHKYLAVKDDDLSTISTLTGSFHHTAQRLGLVDGPITVSVIPLLNVISVGPEVIYDLVLRETVDSSINFALNPSIQFGDEVKYVLETNYGSWIHRDTIVKTFGAITQQFVDNATNTTNWTGNWNTTTEEFVSPSTSFTDSPNGNYQNNTTRNYTFNQVVDLTLATAATVSFSAKWAIEADYDYCQFQVSNNGSTWVEQCGKYTVPGISADGSVQPEGKPVWEGVQSNWVKEEINLSDYLGQVIQLRFQLKSDGGSNQDGFYFDDFVLSYNLQDTTTNVSIPEIEDQGISLFPNPTSGKFEVKGLEIGSKLIIYDISGNLVHSQVVKKETENIELKAVSEGTYIMNTSKSNELVKISFVVKR